MIHHLHMININTVLKYLSISVIAVICSLAMQYRADTIRNEHPRRSTRAGDQPARRMPPAN